MIKVSVIVPVYNVEEFLSKCIDSLVKQTLKEIEILVINDGSPDNSQEIIDKYKKKYPVKIRAFKKKNGGLSDARNYGIKKARGEYIAFVDSDDYVDKNMFKKMYDKAKRGNFDVVACDVNITEGDKLTHCSANIDGDLLTKQDIKNKMIYFYPTAWNKIYKKDLIKTCEFKKGVWYEDVEFMYRLIPSINTIGVVKEPFYYYVQREGAITKTFNEKVFHYIDNWKGIIDYHKQNNTYEEYKEELEYSYVRYLYATMMKALAKSGNKEMYNRGLNEAIELVNKNFPNYRKNKYIKQKGFKNLYLRIFNPFIANIYYKGCNLKK